MSAWIVVGIGYVVIGVTAVCACIRSTQINRDEERWRINMEAVVRFAERTVGPGSEEGGGDAHAEHEC